MITKANEKQLNVENENAKEKNAKENQGINHMEED